MVGLSETYFAAFFVAAGLSEMGIGMLATLPYLIGSGLQLFTPLGVRLVGSYRLWTAGTAALQSFSLLMLAGLTWIGQVNFLTLLAIVSIYWASGLATGPAWTTWIEFVVPRRIRARYFSVRMRICQLCLLVSIAVAGFLLRSSSYQDQQILIFVAMFAVAGILRLLSCNALRLQIEKRQWLEVNIENALRAKTSPDVGRLIQTTLPFFAAMQFAVYISGPYFAPFMLKTLGMGYMQYMILILLGYFGRVLTLAAAGRFANRFGPVKLMLIGAIGIVPMSALWLFHPSVLILCVVQCLSGVAWGCYELAMSLVFIERIPAHHRIRVLTWFNVFNGIAMVGGSLLGGWMLLQFGASVQAFMFLFVLSGIFRMVALLWFPYSMLKEEPATAGLGVGQPWSISPPLLNGRSIVRPFFIPHRESGLSPLTNESMEFTGEHELAPPEGNRSTLTENQPQRPQPISDEAATAVSDATIAPAA